MQILKKKNLKTNKNFLKRPFKQNKKEFRNKTSLFARRIRSETPRFANNTRFSPKRFNYRLPLRRSFTNRDFFLKGFANITYFFFKKGYGLREKVNMLNYWKVIEKFTQPDFSFSFSQLDGTFYIGVVRSYVKSIKVSINFFLRQQRLLYSRRKISRARVLKTFYKIYRIKVHLNHLFRLCEKPLKRPNFFFKGYRSVLRSAFFRSLTMFLMKIFLLTNRIFSDKKRKIKTSGFFFYLWKKVYKAWLNKYYAKPSVKRRVPRLTRRNFLTARLCFSSAKSINPLFWRSLFNFREERVGYKKTLLNYLFKYAQGNYRRPGPFGYKKKKLGFNYNIFGKKVFLNKKPIWRRKSRKYISWFRYLVKLAHYFSKNQLEKTFFRKGGGRRAWIQRRQAKRNFKMKFVFIRYFSKRFGLKNRTAFLRKAEHVARKGGNKWLRYYKEFESRLQRVLLLFGFCSNNEMSKNFISNNWVLINKKVFNDHNYKFIPRVKMGDVVSLTSAASAYVLKKKSRFFKKRLVLFGRADAAKMVYNLFKKHFFEWTTPTAFSIIGPVIKHGSSALMSGPVVTNSKFYFNISKFIPFYNRTLFKLFIQKFTKKLN